MRFQWFYTFYTLRSGAVDFYLDCLGDRLTDNGEGICSGGGGRGEGGGAGGGGEEGERLDADIISHLKKVCCACGISESEGRCSTCGDYHLVGPD
jgi:hypothetical protein